MGFCWVDFIFCKGALLVAPEVITGTMFPMGIPLHCVKALWQLGTSKADEADQAREAEEEKKRQIEDAIGAVGMENQFSLSIMNHRGCTSNLLLVIREHELVISIRVISNSFRSFTRHAGL